jgi:hypothetical protein
MANDLQTGSEPSVTSLVTGIINDAQELFKQQLALLKHEVREDIHKTALAVASLGAGAAVAVIGGLMLCFMFVQILHEVAGLPQWGSYGIVGAVFLVIGGILVALGVQKVRTVNPLHNDTTEALKENVQWIMKPK